MRIISGSAKGRPIAGPKNDRLIRPTSDRTRETIFNMVGQRCDGLRVLDLYCGTGALGLEALSRGAADVTFVDRARESIALCRKNLETLGFTDRASVLVQDVERALGSLRGGAPFDLIFSDAPYAAESASLVAAAVARGALLAPSGYLVIEHGKREPVPQAPEGLVLDRTRVTGDTALTLFQAAPAPVPAEP